MDRKVRYAVVGLGWIAQESILPAFANAPNSTLAALVTGELDKGRKVAGAYGNIPVHSYDEYDTLISSGNVDAVFIALPNNMHADYTVRAANKKIHVLCEKPMAGNAAECETMINAAKANNVKLMIAYRLHFERANMTAVDWIKKGRIGKPRIFSSIFSEQVEEGNIRLKKKLDSGPLMDIGIYCINATRYLFQAEPNQVVAIGGKGNDPRFREVHESVAVSMQFPDAAFATFSCSFGAASSGSWTIAGTEGAISLEPPYDYHKPMKLKMQAGEKEDIHEFQPRDQFGPEIEYFSDCILQDREPEPGGREGLADQRIIDALLQSMREGRPIDLPSFDVGSRPDLKQVIDKPLVKAPEIVHAQSPSSR